MKLISIIKLVFFLLFVSAASITGYYYINKQPATLHAVVTGNIYRISVPKSKKINSICINTNSFVQKDELIISIDGAKYLNKIKEYECSLPICEENITIAKKNLDKTMERYLKAKEEKSENYLKYLNDLDYKQRRYNLRQMQLKKLKLKIENLKQKIIDQHIYSPCSGKLLMLPRANEEALQILENNHTWIEAIVDEKAAAVFLANKKVAVFFPQHPQLICSGIIQKHEYILNQSTLSSKAAIKIKVELDNDPKSFAEALEIGMAARVYLK